MNAGKKLRCLRWAAFLALVGVVLIVWSVFDPTPVPIIVTMSLGQVIGTLSFGLYLLVVLPDLRKTIERTEADTPTPASASESASESASASASESESSPPGSHTP